MWKYKSSQLQKNYPTSASSSSSTSIASSSTAAPLLNTPQTLVNVPKSEQLSLDNKLLSRISFLLGHHIIAEQAIQRIKTGRQTVFLESIEDITGSADSFKKLDDSNSINDINKKIDDILAAADISQKPADVNSTTEQAFSIKYGHVSIKINDLEAGKAFTLAFEESVLVSDLYEPLFSLEVARSSILGKYITSLVRIEKKLNDPSTADLRILYPAKKKLTTQIDNLRKAQRLEDRQVNNRERTIALNEQAIDAYTQKQGADRFPPHINKDSFAKTKFTEKNAEHLESNFILFVIKKDNSVAVLLGLNNCNAEIKDKTIIQNTCKSLLIKDSPTLAQLKNKIKSNEEFEGKCMEITGTLPYSFRSTPFDVVLSEGMDLAFSDRSFLPDKINKFTLEFYLHYFADEVKSYTQFITAHLKENSTRAQLGDERSTPSSMIVTQSSFGIVSEDELNQALENAYLKPQDAAMSLSCIIDLHDIPLEKLPAEGASILFDGINVLLKKDAFKDTQLSEQVTVLLKKYPKIDGILKLMDMYQKNHLDHVQDDPYLELCRSVKFIELYNTVSNRMNKPTLFNLENEIKTLDSYLWNRAMTIENAAVDNANLTVKSFDDAAFIVINKTRELMSHLDLKITASEEEFTKAMSAKSALTL